MSGRTARVGMVGGGQLARMTHQAAIGLGIDLTVLADDEAAPAVAAGARLRPGTARDEAALLALAAASDVVTFDHEGVPLDHMRRLVAAGHAVHPPPDAKALAKDKLLARRTLAAGGFPVPEFAAVDSLADVREFVAHAGWPVVLKARSGGYDGRGVEVARDERAAAAALAAFGGSAVAEELVEIATEVAVLIARRPGGESVTYPPVETRQRDGMCRELVCPADLPAATAADAADLAERVARSIGATGIVAVELFVTAAGRIVVNELALRPHNSGHWSIEGAETSQFEQHLRAVLDWPLGSTALRAPAVATVNVVGTGGADPSDRLPHAIAVPGAHVHLYRKTPRPGRKLGHVTALGATRQDALATARAAAVRLEDR